MKVKLSLSLLVFCLIAASSAFAQTGVAGKWTGELSAADGHGIAQPISIDLKLDGTTLSGTVAEGALEARPIQAATVDGNNVTFRTTRNLGGADINVNWKGQVTGDALALSREIGPAPAEAGGGRGGAGGGGGGGRGGAAAGAAAPAAGGGRGGAGGAGGGRGAAGAAPAAGGQRGAAAPAADGAGAPPIPPVPNADGAAPAAGGRGAAGGGRGGAAAAGGGGGGGRGGAAAAPPGPTVQLTLRRVK